METQPEYIHPYLIRSSNSSLSASYPFLFFSAAMLYQVFVPDFTISATQKTDTNSHGKNHVISSYSDLGVTLDIPSSNLRFFLVRGSPYITAFVTKPTSLSITTVHTIVSLSSNDGNTKYTLQLNNTQTWLIYTSSPINLNHEASEIKSKPFSGIIRIAVVPGSNPKYALSKDANELNSSVITTNSSYYYGKHVARAARLALIAEEVSFPKVIPTIRKYLKETIEPWLDGTFIGNAFLYDKKWGGVVTKKGSTDSSADFGFGIYNDHHYHLGYFLYGIAVLAKLDPSWGQKYKPQAYSLVTDFMNLDQRYNSNYPRLRCFDPYKLHSWAAGLTEFENGRNQESSSEAVNAYYSAALMGLAYGDTGLAATGSTLTALEIGATQMWWHVKVEDNLYEEDFSEDNRIVGIVWANKRDSKLWWAPAECRDCRLLIQVLPLLPVTEHLFSDAAYAKEFVEWTLPSLKNKTNAESGKGFTYALQGIYDKETALKNIRMLKGFDDGNSFTNLLWWIHSR
ncbi:Endo-1 [Sesbania bispinosa]|nr:Endo-1 [Sesbania bispinosa]